MVQIFSLLDCIAWSFVYIIAIIIGLKDRTLCIPGIPICLNFSWELFVVMFRILNNGAAGLGFLIQIIWLLLDIPILILWLYYSRNNNLFWKNLSILIIAMGFIYIVAYRAGYWAYSAFFINLLMSVMFVYRKIYDPAQRTSLSIAILKLIGTLAATIGNGVLVRNSIVLWLGGLCLLLDIYYLILLLRKRKGKEYEI